MEKLTVETFKTKIFDFENNEEWKYLGENPCILTFSALGWCQPCKQLQPIVEELSQEYTGRVNFYEIDIEEEIKLTEIFNIRSVPTLLFIPMEGEPKKLIGGVGKDKLKTLIYDNLKIQ